MKKVAIIGGGAAGMMAAICLARQQYEVVLFEKNEKLGKKLFITGKGRCNLTNDCSVSDLLANVVTNSKFMYSAFHGFDSAGVIEYFESIGLKTKTERGNRVFPASDHSSDVLKVLNKQLELLHVDVKLLTTVTKILTNPYSPEDEKSKYEQKIHGLIYKTRNGKTEQLLCDAIVVATGGMSYPLTGSTGDGYKFAQELGITVTTLRPALVPMCAEETLCKELMGLTLKNVRLSFVANIKNKDKVVYSDMGELLFTHFGVSGPIVLSASSYVQKYFENNLRLVINLKPALSREQLDARILRDFSENHNKQLKNALDALLPKRLIGYVIGASGIDSCKKVSEISKAEREQLLLALSEFTIHINGIRGFEEAIITQGGISVKEINPKTMEAKKVKNLYFAGEVLDVDALTGGFNLQIAWSSAFAVSLE